MTPSPPPRVSPADPPPSRRLGFPTGGSEPPVRPHGGSPDTPTPLRDGDRPRSLRHRPSHHRGGLTSSRHCFWHIWQYQRNFCSPLDLMRLAMALGLRKSDFPIAATLTLRHPAPSHPSAGSDRPPPPEALPAGPGCAHARCGRADLQPGCGGGAAMFARGVVVALYQPQW